MAKYIDSGSGQADQDVGHWLDANVVDGIREFRCQFGYFRYSAIEPFAEVIRDLAAAGGQVHFVLGSNFGSLIAADAQRVLRVAMGDHASLSIVAFANAEFHPKTVQIVREDSSVTAFVGSSNLTGRGLGQNVEAGVIFDSRAGDPACQLERIRDAIDWWRELLDAPETSQAARAVFRITRDDDLRRLAERGIINVPQPSRPRPGSGSGAGGEGNPLPHRSPTWRPLRGWRPEIPDIIEAAPDQDDPEEAESRPGSTAPTPPGGTEPIASRTQEVLLMRVRPRRVYDRLSDGTPLGTQVQLSIPVHNAPFLNGTEEVVSAADGARRSIGYDYVTRRGVRVRNTARFEAPEMRGMVKPVARFKWVDVGTTGREAERVLQVELFDAANGGVGAEIFKTLEEGISSPPETDLARLSHEETVLSIPNRVRSQWYRLDSA